MAERAPHYALLLRLKPQIGQLLEDLSERMGMDKTSVLVVALRDLARKEGMLNKTEEEEGNA